MKVLKVVFAIIFVVGLVANCSSAPPAVVDMPSEPDGRNPSGPSDMPEWFTNTPEEDDTFIYATGSGDSRKMNIAIDKAKQSASVTISERISAHVSSQVKQFTQEAGMTENTQITEFYQSTSKTVTNNTMSGLTVLKKYPYRKKDDTWTAYVLVGLKKGEVNKSMVNLIQNEEALYAEFKASQAFEELEASIK